jgi:hypothetical protein
MTTGHLKSHLITIGLLWGIPPKVESLLRRLTVTRYGHNECEAHRMMSRIMKAADIWIREIFNDREWRRLWWNIRQSHRTKVFFEVTQ